LKKIIINSSFDSDHSATCGVITYSIITNTSIMKNIIIIITALVIATPAFAQQEIILTKYTFNSMFFNPAYAGSHGWDEGSINLHYRNQWLGLEGAPTTIMAGGEINMFEDRVGLGITLAQESIGIENRLDISTNYAYRIDLGDSHLAGGLRVGGSFYGTDVGKINAEVTPEGIYDTNINYNVFTTGVGVYFHKDDFYLGGSIPALVAIGNDPGTAYRQRHFYLHSGMMIGDEYSSIKFEPSILIKYQRAAPIQTTLGVNAWLTDGLAIGGHWRSSDALALSVELLLEEKYRLAAAYDFTTSELRKDSNGTIELMLGYNFSTSPETQRIKNIRHGGRF